MVVHAYPHAILQESVKKLFVRLEIIDQYIQQRLEFRGKTERDACLHVRTVHDDVAAPREVRFQRFHNGVRFQFRGDNQSETSKHCEGDI